MEKQKTNYYDYSDFILGLHKQYNIDPNTTYKCFMELCVNHKEQGKPFCIDHACIMTQCRNSKMMQSSSCADHTCIVDKCMEPIQGQSSYCANHICSVINCTHMRRSHSHCLEHACSWNKYYSKCSKARMDGSRYCKSHTCKVDKCNNAVKSNSLCKVHKCNNCNNITMANHSYCSTCKCANKDCDNKHTPSIANTNSFFNASVYCDDHKCAFSVSEIDTEVRCTNTFVKGSICCYNHACKYIVFDSDGKEIKCSASIFKISNKKDQLVNTMACETHKCSSRHCVYVKDKNSTYCVIHRCTKMNCKSKRFIGVQCLKHILS